ncbi:MAG: sigma-54-dependent Fis family transcriptional regulator [Acidobacteria bacterium]|nr:MAG: sigma-54-dependent Fis family transcriptional regulator [Acidobacteriota bacterium]
MNPRISGISGPFQGTTYSLASGELSIGRDPSNHLWISDPALSRQHCLLTRKGDRFFIRDLGSRNGTIVNGMTVDELQLQHGDQISIGTSVLKFLLGGGEENLKRSRVEFVETMAFENLPVIVHAAEASLLQVDKSPETARLARDLTALLNLAKHIGGIRDLESLQWQLLGFIFDVVPAERGAILLFEHPDEFSSVIAWDRVRGPGCSVQVSRTIVQRVARERTGLVTNDIFSDEGLRQIRTLTELQIRSVLCVPLLAGDEVLGMIYLDSQHRSDQFDEGRLQVMTAIAGIAALALGNVCNIEQLQKENQQLQAEINLEHNLVGNSQSMQKVFELIRRVAPTESTVLIEGESGTGKELAARAVHRNSPRAERPFVAINCAAIPDSLLETELFGHEKGAFTGASSLKKGRLETAEGGTLFLDEISELAGDMQAKLLRVLQEREFERVGSNHPIKLDIRVVAATNKNLAEVVKTGAFRTDLYHRLNVVTLTLPALRERRDDIPALAEHLIAKVSRKCKMRPKQLSPEAKACLMRYQWPGNIRELENALEHAIVLGSSNTILPDDLPEAIVEMGSPALPLNAHYHAAITDFKKQLVREAFRQAKGSYLEAAKNLGMHPNSLLRLIRSLDLRSDLQAR